MNARAIGIALTTLCCFYASVDTSAQTFEPLANFPAPAAGSFTVVGAGLPDGRFALWNGDEVFVQDAEDAAIFNPVASGYVGDPGFAAVSPDGSTLLLGAGFTPKLYRLEIGAWQDHSVAVEIDVPTHFAGVYLNQNIVALDRGKDDFSGAEIVVVDVSGSKSTSAPFVVLSSPSAKSQIIDKPPFAYSAQIAVNDARTTLYVMDANTRELRAFDVADLIDAYSNTTALDWTNDGVAIGTPELYYNGGPAGVFTDGNVAIGGAAGFGGQGGIQIVNPATGAVVDTLDPTGAQQYVSVIFNSTTGAMIALDGFTFDAYATTDVPGNQVNLPALDFAGLSLLALVLVVVAVRFCAFVRV